VVDPVRLQVRRRITLRGDFSFDAISPDGSTLYLVEYLSLGRRNFDPTNYLVRALDARSGRLDPKPIVDPREPDEKMGGFPVTRATGPDGRWVYTLYEGGEHPFVHALDTTGRSARCIDLDALSGREDVFRMRLLLGAGGRDLAVVLGKEPVALVDTATFEVTEPRAQAAEPRRPGHAGEEGGRSWLLSASAALVLLIGLGALLAARARPLARGVRAR
jgi:hypothetical protein